MFEELLKEIKDTLDNTKYDVVVPVPHKKLWGDLCDVLQSTGVILLPTKGAPKRFLEEIYTSKQLLLIKLNKDSLFLEELKK